MLVLFVCGVMLLSQHSVRRRGVTVGAWVYFRHVCLLLHSPPLTKYTRYIQQVLEPLLQSFNEPEPNARLVEDENDTGDDDNDDDDEFFDTGSIGDDIAALEAELREEEGLLLEEDISYGEAGALTSHLPGGKEELVRKAAWCLFEVLLPRCVGLEGQGLETRLEEPTSFSHRRVEDICVLIFYALNLYFQQAHPNHDCGTSSTQPLLVRKSPLGVALCHEKFYLVPLCLCHNFQQFVMRTHLGYWWCEVSTFTRHAL